MGDELGFDLLELARGHIVLKEVEVLVAVLSKVKYSLILFGIDHGLDAKPLCRIELYEPLVLLVQDDEEHVLVTLGGNLDALLDKSPFAFVIRHTVLFLH